jgi:hypothetical protein
MKAKYIATHATRTLLQILQITMIVKIQDFCITLAKIQSVNWCLVIHLEAGKGK